MGKTITIDDIKQKYTNVVAITDFTGDGTINFNLKRPSIMGLASSGKIPNELMSVLSDLFVGKKSENDIDLKQMNDIYVAVAKESLASPTYEELEQNGIMLTDTQLAEIYQYVSGGVKALENFRTLQRYIEDTASKQILQNITEQDIKS